MEIILGETVAYGPMATGTVAEYFTAEGERVFIIKSQTGNPVNLADGTNPAIMPESMVTIMPDAQFYPFGA